MPVRLLPALLVSALLHGAGLLLLMQLVVTGPRPAATSRPATELAVTLRTGKPQPAQVPTAPQPAPPAEPPANPAAIPPAADSTPPPAPEQTGLVSADVDTNWYGPDELEVRAQPLGLIEPTFPGTVLQGTGRVVLEVYIDELGATDHVTVISASPPGLFDQQAIAAFEQARWQPAVKAGRFVRSRKQVEVCFGECPLEPGDAQITPLLLPEK